MLARAISSWGRLLGWGKDASDDPNDRRSHGRAACDVETTCQPASRLDGKDLPARVRNVSRGGVRLVLLQPFQPGELLSLVLPAGEGQEPCCVLACVAHCTAADDGWQVGCTFATPLDEDDLARFFPGARPDQRARERFPTQAAAAFTVIGGTDPAPWSADVVNISTNGVALRTSEALPIGALLSLQLRRGDEQPTVTTLASVVRTSIAPSGDRIAGCNFIHELPEEQVQALL